MFDFTPNSSDRRNQKMLLIKNDILDDHKIGQLFTDAHNIVFGEGDLNAKIMIIGEAPGKNEDLTGQPFMGASGKILNKLLASINLSRRNVYITNIVKYRPTANRDPSKLEKTLFLPYLLKQISVIKPKLLITLGRHSLNCFKPKLLIKNDHGKILDITLPDLLNNNQPDSVLELQLIPMYHPAATIYNHHLTKTLTEDFLRIPTLISNRSII